MTLSNNYKIALGHDNQSNFRSIKAVIGAAPKGLGEYDQGDERRNGLSLIQFGGFETFDWPFSYVELDVPIILSNWLCSGGRSGLVTVQTYTDDPLIPRRYNATMILPPLKGLKPSGLLYKPYKIEFIHAVRLP